MGIFDRFKSKKEKELTGQAPASASVNAKSAPKKESKKSATKTSAPRVLPAHVVGVIVKPLVTEKSAVLASKGQYSFVVSQDANRTHVRDAVKAMYGIQPTSVNIQRVRGKVVRFGRMTGRRRSWKKAIVTLPAGKTIDIYEGV